MSAYTDGSSPLARGTYALASRDDWPRRLIPARAGNIGGVHGRSRWLPAHPRSRGEHWRTSIFRLAGGGSSPLARGTCLERLLDAAVERLIPARAGNMWVGAPPCIR